MTLSREAMLEVMAYADDELDAEARARVEEMLRTNEEARGVLEAMGTLGEVVRVGVEARAEESAQADGIADGVMAAIAREPTGRAGTAGDGAKVASLAEARRARGGVTTATIAVLALAAGAVFFLRSKPPAPVASDAPLEPVASVQPSTTAPTAPPEPTAVAQASDSAQDEGVDLEEVQSTKNKVNVFFVPPAVSGAMTSVVVWIDDRPGAH